MSKNTRWSPDDMKNKGLIEVNGQFVKASSQVAKKVEKLPNLIERAIDNKLLTELDGEFEEEPAHHEVHGYGDYDVQQNLFGEPEPVKEAVQLSPALMGDDILAIRVLTGKKRDNAIAALYDATVSLFEHTSTDCFFIPGNTASSKNAKEIGFYLKKDPVTGKNEKVNILMDSKVTKAYKKATAGYWLQNKVAFLNQTRHLPLPLSIEFTFIRDSMRRYDTINACQIVADMMTEYGWIPDDESVYFHPVFNKVTYYHNKLAGVLIRVIK